MGSAGAERRIFVELMEGEEHLQSTVDRTKALRARDDVEQLVEQLIHPAVLEKFAELKLKSGNQG